jgi:hypothetical protein
MKRGIQRSLLHRKHIVRKLLDAFRDSPPMKRLARERLQDEKVQCSLEQI